MFIITNRDTYLCSSLQWGFGSVLGRPCPIFTALLRHFHVLRFSVWSRLQSCWKSFHWTSFLRIWEADSSCPRHCFRWL